ncbi:hypothetical protein [Caulobacter sp. 17J80-11]|nr:hypothetical protein [Caulobacter sp. 17J80-11]
MSKRKKAVAGAFGVFITALLVIYAVHVRETGQMWPAARHAAP